MKNILLPISLLFICSTSGMTNEPSPKLSEVQLQQFKDIVAASAAKDLREAERICRDMEAADPLNPLILKKCAETFFREGRLHLASQYFRRTIQILPNDVEAHFNLGLILYNNGQMREADGEFIQVLALKPDHAEAREWRDRVAKVLAGKIPESEKPRETAFPLFK